MPSPCSLPTRKRGRRRDILRPETESNQDLDLKTIGRFAHTLSYAQRDIENMCGHCSFSYENQPPSQSTSLRCSGRSRARRRSDSDLLMFQLTGQPTGAAIRVEFAPGLGWKTRYPNPASLFAEIRFRVPEDKLLAIRASQLDLTAHISNHQIEQQLSKTSGTLVHRWAWLPGYLAAWQSGDQPRGKSLANPPLCPMINSTKRKAQA